MHSTDCPENKPLLGGGYLPESFGSFYLPTPDQPVKTYGVYLPYYTVPPWEPYAPTLPLYVQAPQIAFAIGSAHSGVCQVCGGPVTDDRHTIDFPTPDGHPFANFLLPGSVITDPLTDPPADPPDPTETPFFDADEVY